MTAPVIYPRHIFGLKTDVSSPLHFLEDSHEVLYAAGHQIVLAHLPRRQQRFIAATDMNGSNGTCEIVALAVSPNKRFLAFGERCAQSALVTIVDLRTLKKRRALTGITSKDVLSMSFSSDNKHVIALCGGPSYSVIEWQWQKEQITAQSSFSWPSQSQPKSVMYHPTDSSQLIVTGSGILSFLTVDWDTSLIHPTVKNRLIDEHIESSDEITSCTFNLDSAFLIVTSLTGVLRVFDSKLTFLSSMQAQELELTPDETLSGRTSALASSITASPKHIQSIAAWRLPSDEASSSSSSSSSSASSSRQGFVLGCDSGIAQFYELVSHTTEGEGSPSGTTLSCFLRKSCSIPHHPATISHLAVAPDLSALIAITDTQQAFNMNSPLNAGLDRMGTHNHTVFEPMLWSSHTGAITGMDVCVRKPLIATCGVDRSVRLYNTFTLECDLVAFFPEQPLCLSFHPSGLMLLIGFADKLRLCSVLLDALVPQKEFPIKNCADCAFSHGGHCLAAVNGSLIQIYHTYTGEQLAVFRGHTAMIRSLAWSEDDQRLVSAGSDGAVYQRRLGSNGARLQEIVQKGCKFSCAIVTNDDKLYAVGDDKMLKEIVEKSLNKTLDAGVQLTQIAVNTLTPHRMLIAGTLNGVLRSFAFPLTGIVKDYQCHSKAVTKVKITHDDSFLCSTGEDGILALYSLKSMSLDKEREEGSAAATAIGSSSSSSSTTASLPSSSLTLPMTLGLELSDGLPYSDEVLVSRSSLDESSALLLELQARVDELRANNDYQLRLHEMNYTEKLKEVTEKYQLQLEHDRSKCEMLGDEAQELEAEFEEKLRSVRQNLTEKLQADDLMHQNLVVKQLSDYEATRRQQAQLVASLASEAARAHQKQSAELAALRSFFEAQLTDLSAARAASQASIARVQSEFHESAAQAATDFDTEIESLKSNFAERLLVERDSTLRFKGENGIMRKKLSVVAKEIEDLKENLKLLVEKEEQVSLQIGLFEAKIAAQKKEIKEKDRRIAECERIISELKKDNQELEKFKFVLDSQIKELKKAIEPREREIGEIQRVIGEIDVQLERQHARHAQLLEKSDDLEQDNARQSGKIHAWRDQIRSSQRRIAQFARQLQQLARLNPSDVQFQPLLARILSEFSPEALAAASSSSSVSPSTSSLPAFLPSSSVAVTSLASAAKSSSSVVVPSSQASSDSSSAPSPPLIDSSVQKEAERHRMALEERVGTLQRTLFHSARKFEQSQAQLLAENVQLIKEIHGLTSGRSQRSSTLAREIVASSPSSSSSTSLNKTSSLNSISSHAASTLEQQKLLEMQRCTIVALREQIRAQQAIQQQ